MASGTAKGGGRSETRARLLQSACRHFAAEGWHGARVQEICRDAGANIAAVNYHFGGKAGLYRAVWDLALERSVVAEKSGEPLSKDEDREWLYAYIRACVHSVFDTGTGGLLRRLLAHEAASPSPDSDELISGHLAPRGTELVARLRRLVGPDATDWQIGCCVFAIHSQFTALALNRAARRALFLGDSPSPAEAEGFCREICAFVMGGIRALRSVPPQARRSRT
ncbi:MAG: TetR/AcrR family transcriptional regulator [Kiritimatiellae bacterium]|nr:TetR/AcrR family transcriptional regulator [Kiritimatiellia bacterium]